MFIGLRYEFANRMSGYIHFPLKVVVYTMKLGEGNWMDAYKICLEDMHDVNKSFVGYLTGWPDDPIYTFQCNPAGIIK